VESPLEFGQQSVVRRLAQVLKAAVRIDGLILWEWDAELVQPCVDMLMSVSNCWNGAIPARRTVDVCVQRIPQTEKLRIEVIDLRDRRTQ
jgi:hypothetical protein